MSTDRALYEKMYAAQLAEGHDLETAMRYNKAATPEDFLRAFGQSSDPRHQHRKWGGGNKMGSGGAAVNAARRARAEANAASRGPGLGFHIGQMARDVTARFSPTQGKGIATGAEGMGYSNHSRENSYNTHGVGTRGDGSSGTYGSTPSIGSYGSSFSNFTGGLPSSSNLSSFSPSTFLGDMAMNQGPSTPVRQYDGKFLPYFGGGRNGPIRMKAPIQASDPRFAMSIFA